jgi:hypothetical protein
MYPLRDDGKPKRPLTAFTVFLEHCRAVATSLITWRRRPRCAR